MKIMASGPTTSWEIDVETVETVSDFIFLGSKTLQIVTAAMKLKDACSLKEKYDQSSSVQFSHSVASDSLQSHELQHARPPCPSPTPGVYPNSCSLS